MRTVQQWARIKKVHRLIALKKTGTPDALASKMHVSRRFIFRILEQIRSLGGAIEFSRKRNTYYYSNNFKLTIRISVKTKIDGITQEIIKI